MVKKIFKILALTATIILIVLGIFLFVGRPPQPTNITWGIDFSQKHAQNLGLDWQKVYLAYLQDLQVKDIKISTAWDLLEKEKGVYNFADLDWQLAKAQEYGAKVILVIGMKTPRWPECHFPDWAKGLSVKELDQATLRLLQNAVLRYANDANIWAWQVENEPLFPFGQCPKKSRNFLKQEIALVKNLDPLKRPVVISDSGEWSTWLGAGKIGDIVGTTLYQTVWDEKLSMYVNYPFPPIYYYRKAVLIKKLFNKKVIGVELQAEPWGPKLLYDLSLKEQKKSMDLAKFSESIEFAEKTGLDTFYLWGGEWWYWLKEKQADDSFWNAAKKLFFPMP